MGNAKALTARAPLELASGAGSAGGSTGWPLGKAINPHYSQDPRVPSSSMQHQTVHSMSWLISSVWGWNSAPVRQAALPDSAREVPVPTTRRGHVEDRFAVPAALLVPSRSRTGRNARAQGRSRTGRRPS